MQGFAVFFWGVKEWGMQNCKQQANVQQIRHRWGTGIPWFYHVLPQLAPNVWTLHPGALRELRNQRKKPKTAEDLLLHGSDLMIPGPPVGGPGTSLHATMPAEKREVMGGLQALRQEKYQGTT